MFRQTYIILLSIFLVYDIILYGKNVFNTIWQSPYNLVGAKMPLIYGVILLQVFMAFNQSGHRWNNPQFADMDWFPKTESLLDTAFIQGYNIKYISDKYGSFEGKDFYHTNEEVFGGASSVKEAFSYNPEFVISSFIDNVLKFIYLLADNFIFQLNSLYEYSRGVSYFLSFIICLAVGNGAIRYIFKVYQNNSVVLFLFVFGGVVTMSTQVLVMPKGRYMLQVIPVLIFSAIYYSTVIYGMFRSIIHHFKVRYTMVLMVFLIVFRPPHFYLFGTSWFSNILGDAEILMNERGSLRRNYSLIDYNFKNCRGVMALEATFIGALFDIEIDKIYSPYEIPPFKDIDGYYSGLDNERVDCLLISNTLSEKPGMATNHKIRYDDHIKNYKDKLLDSGKWKKVELPGTGLLIIPNVNI